MKVGIVYNLVQAVEIIVSAFLVLTSTSPGDMFIWMPKEHLYVLVYLVTVMHSMQGGYMDKAQKYTDKAFTQIEKLKSEYWSNVFSRAIYFIFKS